MFLIQSLTLINLKNVQPFGLADLWGTLKGRIGVV